MPSENIVGVLDHKKLVGQHMQAVASELFKRAVEHDYSKFSLEEFDLFEEATPLLKTLTYGTEEYKQALASIKPAIQHHYQVNSHHPEYYPSGIDDMSLIDVIEMVCDWMAAVQRVKDGDIYKSLVINKERFRISDQLFNILTNTVNELNSQHSKEQV